MQIKSEKRQEAIENINVFFDDLENPTCNEHIIVRESHIVGFALACKMLKVFSEDEFIEVQKFIKSSRNNRTKPTFLNN
ncbi:hypothetical protein [Comamonas sp.]|uniref:hypothetical protein n=1 Tax=Comamonas sp. TaxID=34028 RepID=UPI0012C3D47F|nr:hypothetical protein [Comamonas sp.]MPS92948.1 hypothetical protein [Comamonas sp.]